MFKLDLQALESKVRQIVFLFRVKSITGYVRYFLKIVKLFGKCLSLDRLLPSQLPVHFHI